MDAGSQNNLESARILLQARKYAGACSFAQQSAEKAFKAALIAADSPAARKHAIADLVAETERITQTESPPEVASARGLDIFYTASRYPDAVPGSKAPSQIITENQAEDALCIAMSTVEYLNGILEAHAKLVRNPESEQR